MPLPSDWHRDLPYPGFWGNLKSWPVQGWYNSNPGDMTCLSLLRSMRESMNHFTNLSKILVFPCDRCVCFVALRVLCLASQAAEQPHIRKLHTRASTGRGSFAAVNPVKPFLYGVLLKRVVHLRVCAEWRLPADPGEWGSMWVNAPVGASTLKLSVDAPTGAFGNCTSGSFSSASSVSAWCRHTLGGTETLRRRGFPSFSSTNSTNVCTTLAFHVGRPAAAAGIMSQLVRGTGSGRQGLNQLTLSRSRVATCHFYTYTQHKATRFYSMRPVVQKLYPP